MNYIEVRAPILKNSSQGNSRAGSSSRRQKKQNLINLQEHGSHLTSHCIHNNAEIRSTNSKQRNNLMIQNRNQTITKQLANTNEHHSYASLTHKPIQSEYSATLEQRGLSIALNGKQNLLGNSAQTQLQMSQTRQNSVEEQHSANSRRVLHKQFNPTFQQTNVSSVQKYKSASPIRDIRDHHNYTGQMSNNLVDSNNRSKYEKAMNEIQQQLSMQQKHQKVNSHNQSSFLQLASTQQKQQSGNIKQKFATNYSVSPGGGQAINEILVQQLQQPSQMHGMQISKSPMAISNPSTFTITTTTHNNPQNPQVSPNSNFVRKLSAGQRSVRSSNKGNSTTKNDPAKQTMASDFMLPSESSVKHRDNIKLFSFKPGNLKIKQTNSKTSLNGAKPTVLKQKVTGTNGLTKIKFNQGAVLSIKPSITAIPSAAISLNPTPRASETTIKQKNRTTANSRERAQQKNSNRYLNLKQVADCTTENSPNTQQPTVFKNAQTQQHAGKSPETTLSNEEKRQEAFFFHPNLVKKPLQVTNSKQVTIESPNPKVELLSSKGHKRNTVTTNVGEFTLVANKITNNKAKTAQQSKTHSLQASQIKFNSTPGEENKGSKHISDNSTSIQGTVIKLKKDDAPIRKTIKIKKRGQSDSIIHTECNQSDQKTAPQTVLKNVQLVTKQLSGNNPIQFQGKLKSQSQKRVQSLQHTAQQSQIIYTHQKTASQPRPHNLQNQEDPKDQSPVDHKDVIVNHIRKYIKLKRQSETQQQKDELIRSNNFKEQSDEQTEEMIKNLRDFLQYLENKNIINKEKLQDKEEMKNLLRDIMKLDLTKFSKPRSNSMNATTTNTQLSNSLSSNQMQMQVQQNKVQKRRVHASPNPESVARSMPTQPSMPAQPGVIHAKVINQPYTNKGIRTAASNETSPGAFEQRGQQMRHPTPQKTNNNYGMAPHERVIYLHQQNMSSGNNSSQSTTHRKIKQVSAQECTGLANNFVLPGNQSFKQSQSGQTTAKRYSTNQSQQSVEVYGLKNNKNANRSPSDSVSAKYQKHVISNNSASKFSAQNIFVSPNEVTSDKLTDSEPKVSIVNPGQMHYGDLSETSISNKNLKIFEQAQTQIQHNSVPSPFTASHHQVQNQVQHHQTPNPSQQSQVPTIQLMINTNGYGKYLGINVNNYCIAPSQAGANGGMQTSSGPQSMSEAHLPVNLLAAQSQPIQQHHHQIQDGQGIQQNQHVHPHVHSNAGQMVREVHAYSQNTSQSQGNSSKQGQHYSSQVQKQLKQPQYQLVKTEPDQKPQYQQTQLMQQVHAVQSGSTGYIHQIKNTTAVQSSSVSQNNIQILNGNQDRTQLKNIIDDQKTNNAQQLSNQVKAVVSHIIADQQLKVQSHHKRRQTSTNLPGGTKGGSSSAQGTNGAWQQSQHEANLAQSRGVTSPFQPKNQETPALLRMSNAPSQSRQSSNGRRKHGDIGINVEGRGDQQQQNFSRNEKQNCVYQVYGSRRESNDYSSQPQKGVKVQQSQEKQQTSGSGVINNITVQSNQYNIQQRKDTGQSQERPTSGNIVTQDTAVGDTTEQPQQSQRVTLHDDISKDREILIQYIKSYVKKHKSIPHTTLEFYKFVKLLGKGAFGKITLGIHKLTGKYVAIKSIDKVNIKDEYSRRKVFQEVYILKKIRHSCVIRLLEVFESEKHFLMVMEYAGGGDLLQYVKKRKRLNELSAKAIFKQILYALGHCHCRSVLHRDIKLDNVLMDGEGGVKLCDFGVSRLVKKGVTIQEQCGTPAYLAPEIIIDKGYQGFSADIWSLGVLLYAMVQGTVPFKAQNITDLHKLILKGDFEFPIESVSQEVKDLVRKMLVIDPQKRINIPQMLNHPWVAEIDENNIEYQDEEHDLRVGSTFFRQEVMGGLITGYQNNGNENGNINFVNVENLYYNGGPPVENASTSPEDKVTYSDYCALTEDFMTYRIDEDAMEVVTGFGYPRDLVIQSINRGDVNHATAAYYLLVY